MNPEKKVIKLNPDEPVFIASELFINGKWVKYEYKLEKHPLGSVRISEKKEVKDNNIFTNKLTNQT